MSELERPSLGLSLPRSSVAVQQQGTAVITRVPVAMCVAPFRVDLLAILAVFGMGWSCILLVK